ncbi:pilus assembly protein PilZ [Pseudomonas sp. GW456-L14]|uniref:PilZ domain-containing protein n=1 Tax=unclassified Pseudomonas TaxID=196821 RepID=UPI000C881D3E|nr:MULTISPECIES: PilZ domain-containing protein [unclassified Pseudomonas]PMY41193.1 pilus assembly protein PilZ [Pseudomonas sp. GW456-L14]PMY55100.1 pilus assembly protein PilZ [Pseudomonas sp. GW456-L12]
MFTDRRIERHQLPCFLKVFNRLTDHPIGYLGNVSEDGFMLISQLPMLIGADFELRLQVPGRDGQLQPIEITASCRWCHEDVTPHHYDTGFVLLRSPPEYRELVTALRSYFSFYPVQTSA